MTERKVSPRWNFPIFAALLCLSLNLQVAFAQDQTDKTSRFRVERTPVAGGAELITIWARDTRTRSEELPLVTVLRDTLGDENKENDILRQVWVHTYAQPTLVQNAAALVPFLYNGVRVEPRKSGSPRAIINLADTSRPVWTQLWYPA